MKIGERIKKIRLENKHSIIECSSKLGISKSTLSAYENSLTNPSIKILIKISSVYNISIDYILKGTNFNIEYNDSYLISLCKQVDQLPKKSRERIKSVIETLIKNEEK